MSADENIEIETILNKTAHAEYLVCTKALDSAKPNTVIGFGLLQSPPGLVLLLSSGQVVTLNIITNPSFLRVNRPIEENKSNENPESTIQSKVFAGSFVESVRGILASGASQPILKSNTGRSIKSQIFINRMTDSTSFSLR